MIARGIASLLRGQPPLSTIFWEYTIGWGTLLNLVCSGLALVLFLNGWPAIGLLAHFAPVPLNAVLIVSVFRAAAREHYSPLANFSRVASVIWFIVMLAI